MSRGRDVTVGYLIDMLTGAVKEGKCSYDTVVEVSVPMGWDETPFRRIFAGLAGDLNCSVTCMILCEQGEDNKDMQS